MNPIFQYIISETVKRRLKKKKYQSAQFEKVIKNTNVEFSHLIRESFFILVGVLSAGFGLKGFLLPNMFIDGGVMGISLTIAELTEIPLSVLIVVINLPFLIMGFSTIFGGFFLGLGIGLAIRGGSVIDGTEVLAIFVSKKTSLTIGDIILIFNVFIFLVAAYVFTIEISLYAMLTYLAASKTVDFVVSGVEEYVGVTIISDYSDEIRLAIIEKLGRGCTIYSGKRGQTLERTEIVYTLITRLELAKLHTEIDKIDKDAFVVMHSIKDAKGGMIKKRPLK
jgi:uncharacterized membrane-anchored protein YitT (DUF2179 family)